MKRWTKIRDLNLRRRARYKQDAQYRRRILAYYSRPDQRKKRNARNRRRYSNEPTYRTKFKRYRRLPRVKARRRLAIKVRRQTDPAYVLAARERARQWYHKNWPRARTTRRIYYRKNKKHIYAWYKTWRKANLDRARAIVKRHQLKRRNELLDAYGGRCTCCGEREAKFLTLEHVLRDGAKHRKMTPNVYADLRKRGYPKDKYTLLCWNCNCATKNGEPCPHQLGKMKLPGKKFQVEN